MRNLESELSQIEAASPSAPDNKRMVSSGALVTLTENAETRYLGPSSGEASGNQDIGIAMTRLVMELAKQETKSRSIQDIISDAKAHRIRERFSLELAKPTSKIYPLVSSVAAPDLPSRELTEKLVELFNRKAQFMLPTLHEPSFRQVIDDVYNGSADAYQNFVLRMVLSVSMQKLDSRYAGLADSYYLAAMPHLEDSIRRKDIGTLQCLALIAQYSMVTPTRAASYWVVGLASKLCQELGLTQEATIDSADPRTGVPPNALEVDMRRRMLWIIYSMETGLAHSLGRPSAFGCTFDYVDVKPFESVDDEYICKEGVVSGCPRSMKKRVAIHFLSMRFLQLEIRKRLYLKERPLPKDDQDPWFHAMEEKLRRWMDSAPREDGGSGLDEVWFKGRFNTMIIFLYRPSPQIPSPSLAAARTCFEACVFNVRMHRNQVATKSVDLSWIWTQSTFMVLNTILWAISYPEIRQEHSRMVVENHVKQAQECILAASERWPGVEAALELYETLISACLKAYDAPKPPAGVVTIKKDPSPMPFERDISQPIASSPSTMVSSFGSPQPSEDTAASSPTISNSSQRFPQAGSMAQQHMKWAVSHALDVQHPLENKTLASLTTYPAAQHLDPAASHMVKQIPLPAMQTPTLHSTTQQPQLDLSAPTTNFDQYFAMMGDPYFQYFQVPGFHQPPLPSLNQAQQGELMRSLESDSVTYSWRFP
ncbi:MAG: hypothetical protein Q9219_005254 [cf. Caloplaca sp. 3 TL-2023]